MSLYNNSQEDNSALFSTTWGKMKMKEIMEVKCPRFLGIGVVMVMVIAITYISFYQIRGTVLSSLHIEIYVIPVTAIWGKYCAYSHLTEGEIEAQKRKKT